MPKGVYIRKTKKKVVGNHTRVNINNKTMREALERIANVPYIKVVKGSPRELFFDQVTIAQAALDSLRKEA